MNRSMNILLLGVLILAACGENTSGTRYSDFGYYLSGILEEGTFVGADNAIVVGKTQDLDDIVWSMLHLANAEVILEEYWQGELLQTIALSWNETARGYVDAQQEMRIKAKHCYKLLVTLDSGEMLRAETVVPKTIAVYADSLVSAQPAFSDYPLDDNWHQLPLAGANASHPLQIGTETDEEFNLYTEFYCLESYDEAEYTYPPEDNDYPQDEREYMGDSRQYPRRNMSYYMYQPENNLVSYNTYESSILFYGRMEVCVYSIDSNYLNYLYKDDGYLHGGINGGIGIFGSKCGKKLYTRVVKG